MQISAIGLQTIIEEVVPARLTAFSISGKGDLYTLVRTVAVADTRHFTSGDIVKHLPAAFFSLPIAPARTTFSWRALPIAFFP